jgi:hypothetical protein
MAHHTTLRNVIYTVCLLQLLTSIERQVFDFLGYMWLPILGNFLNIIFVIFCIFGVNQRRPNYVYTYSVWSLIWMAWNLFVTCYYMEVGMLDRKGDVLSLGTNSFSWWLANGYGCRPVYYHNISNELIIDSMERNIYHPLRPGQVTGCLLDYQFVEIIHAGVQLVLALVGMSSSIYLIYLFVTDEKRSQTPQKALYSMEVSLINETSNLGHDNALYVNTADENVRPQMTPRRVKRRAYNRSSARSAKSMGRTKRSAAATRAYSSTRVSNNKSINPVTRLLELDPNRGGATQRPPSGATGGLDSSTSNDADQQYGQINPAYESSRPNSLYSSSTANGGPLLGRHHQGAGGHIENSRPPSALTSYSNFHGQRKPAQNHHGGINLTQDSFAQPVVNHHPGGSGPSSGATVGTTADQMNSSFDDLPPPPPPISEDVEDTRPPPPPAHTTTSNQMPVPQQRNQVSRRNEYVNMPVSQPQQPQQQQLDSSVSSDVNPTYNYVDENPNNMQTLRANDRLILPPPRNASSDNATRYYNGNVDVPDASTGARAKQYNGYTPTQQSSDNSGRTSNMANGDARGRGQFAPHQQQQPPPLPPQSSRMNGGNDSRYYGNARSASGMGHRALPPQPPSLSNGVQSSEDDYGFSSMPSIHPKPNQSSTPTKEPAAAEDKWYLKDSMKPVDSPMHGGNCKCYRCQRKLTAI